MKISMGHVRNHLAAFAVGATVLCGAIARGEDLHFSFTGPDLFLFVTSTSQGTFTVTGTIYGLIDNATSVPSSIVASAEGSFVDVGLFKYITGSFTVIDGAVQSDSVSADNRIAFFASPTESITFSGATASLDQYHGDLTGPVTFFSIASAAPEPSTWTLMVAGVVAISAPLRRRWRQRRMTTTA